METRVEQNHAYEFPIGISTAKQRTLTANLHFSDTCLSQLAIVRQDGDAIRFRDGGTVIRKSSRRKPFFTDPKLLPDRDLWLCAAASASKP
jgi:hypothetical protein